MILYVFRALKFGLYLANYVQRASEEIHFNDVNENVLHKLKSLVLRDFPLGSKCDFLRQEINMILLCRIIISHSSCKF